ncbi:hypothetical protein QYF36_008522 [Acer negundo]|nr:hypothetical protein QYF36_008522 [Acer negundo]
MSEKLEHVISSPEVSDFFRRLKLNQKWLNGFKSNLQSLVWFLGDAESKAYVNKEVKVWLDDLNEVNYDLEDLLEEIVTQESSHQDKPRNIKIRIQGIFSAKLSSLEKVIKQRLEEVTVKIEKLQRQSDTLGLRKASWIKRELVVGRYCIEDESQAIGRDEDKEAMLKLLLSDGVSADHDLHTMVGGRGVGKTTLAQLVYNDERVKKQFEFKAWIHVSEDFDDLSLTKAIFLAFTDRLSYIEDLDILQTSLKKHLYRKKFLLVLDNLTMRFDWTNLQKVLTAGSSGSRIIVTTCNHPKLKRTMAGTLPAFTVRGTNLNQMPADMGYLTRLQYLSDFFVGKVSGSQIEQLGPLSNLQGTLHISQLQDLESAGVASEARLEKKAYLQGLELEWNKATADFHTERPVLDKLKPHKNLEKLSIISYGGTRFPAWLGDSSFIKMVFLRLSNCNRCSHLPPLGQLLSLKELEIEGMNGIKMVGPEFYGKNPSSDESFPSHTSSDKPFPSLENLVFREMMEWEEWISPEVEGENFPRLKWIGISGCPKLAKCSPLHLPPSAEVEISGCPLLRVPVTDGNKMQLRSADKLACRPLTPPVWTKFQLPESYRVQLKNDDEIATQYLEHRTNNIPSPSHSSPPELPILLTEFEFEKRLHESHSRKENLRDISSTTTPQKIEELQLRDSNAVHSTYDSIKSNRPPPESYKHLTEDSSAKHEGALDTSSAAAEISDPDTDDPINDGGDKTQFRRNKKLLDRPSTSRLQEIEELQLLSHENMFEAHKNMSEINTFSSVFFKPLEHMISSPEVSDFFLRLELNEKWLNNLLSLDKLLGDAESKAYVNKEVEVWLDDLNEVSYDLEDLLEEIVTEELSHQDKPRNIKIRIQGIFSAKLSSLEKVIKQRLEEITVKIENLQRNSDTLGLRKASRIKREPCQQSLVIGRYKDKEAIIKLLLSDGVSTDQTHVITMVGEHGVGKTTLAQLVYNDDRVKKQFDSKVWIQVSEDLDDLLLTNTIFLAFTSLPLGIEDLDSLQTSLKEYLCKKKFLLVLDNLTMHSDWRNLQKVLTAGEKGSRIIVTTCHPELQETMGTLPAFTVRSLTDQESWMVFARQAFPDKNFSLHPELEDIGKEILDNCRGLPLAAKILGSVLSFKPVEEWRALLKNNKLKWGCPKLAKCSPLRLPPSAEIELSGCSLLRVPVTDGNRMKFVSDNKPAPRPPMPPAWIKLQLPDSYGVQLKNMGETALQYLEDRTGVWSTSLSSPPELSILSKELALSEPPVTAEKQFYESNSRKEKLLGRPSTLRLSEVEELQLPDINLAHSTDVSITSSRPPLESSMPLTEDSSAKHGGALDTSSAATEISSDSDTDTNDPMNDECNKTQFRGNEKLLDRPSTSRFQEIEELQLPVSNVVRRTDVSATSNSPPPESSKHLTEDSSSKHVGASDNSSEATEISSDTNTDDPINVWYDEESLEDISSPEQESLNVSEISQLKRLPPKLYSLKIESCKALKSLTEELMHSNLRHLYIIDCPFLKSIQASQLPMALETIYIRQCKKLEFLSVEETMGKYTSVEHLCIERSCDPLNTFPLSLFPKLKNLSFWDCAKFNSISITEDHMSLNSMEIRDCTNLESLLKSGLRTPNLTSILLSNCKNLRQLPGQLHELTSLQSLIINECPELDSIPEGGLPSSLNLLRIIWNILHFTVHDDFCCK